MHALIAAGRSFSAVSRELDLDIKTVRRFARAATVEDLWPDQRLRRDSVVTDPTARAGLIAALTWFVETFRNGLLLHIPPAPATIGDVLGTT